MCIDGNSYLKSIYIKGIDNTMDDATSRLDYNPERNRHADDKEISKETKWNNFLTIIKHYKTKDGDEQNNNYTLYS